MADKVLLNLLLMIAVAIVNGENSGNKDESRFSCDTQNLSGFTPTGFNMASSSAHLSGSQRTQYSPLASEYTVSYGPQHKSYDSQWASSYDDAQSPSYYSTAYSQQFPESPYGLHNTPGSYSSVHSSQNHYHRLQPQPSPVFSPPYSRFQPPYGRFRPPYSPLQPHPYNGYQEFKKTKYPSSSYIYQETLSENPVLSNIIYADEIDEDDKDDYDYDEFLKNYGSGMEINSFMSYKYPTNSKTFRIPLNLVVLPRTGDDIFDANKEIVDQELNNYDYVGYDNITETVRNLINNGLHIDYLNYNGNYLGLLYAVHTLAEETMCYGADFVQYYPTVIQAVEKVVNNNLRVLENVWNTLNKGLLQSTGELQDIIVSSYYTNPVCKTDLDECNRYIDSLVKSPPRRDRLISQAKSLKHVAKLANVFYDYHDDFVEAANNDKHIEYLIDSQHEIEHLVKAVIEFRTSEDKFCNIVPV